MLSLLTTTHACGFLICCRLLVSATSERVLYSYPYMLGTPGQPNMEFDNVCWNYGTGTFNITCCKASILCEMSAVGVQVQQHTQPTYQHIPTQHHHAFMLC